MFAAKRSLRPLIAISLLIAVAFAQAVAAAHGCALRGGDAGAMPGVHTGCQKGAAPAAPVDIGCDVHCSDVARTGSTVADVPAFAWLPVGVVAAAVHRALPTAGHVHYRSTAPPLAHPLATSSRLLI